MLAKHVDGFLHTGFRHVADAIRLRFVGHSEVFHQCEFCNANVLIYAWRMLAEQRARFVGMIEGIVALLEYLNV